MKKIVIITLLSFLISISSEAITILVDPGHGGDDHGAEAKQKQSKKWVKVFEKDLALSLSKKIDYYLKKEKFNAYLTRSFDRNLSLQERADLAEKIKADYFISVHINASDQKTPRGFETYYLDNHKDDVVKKIEKAENRNLKGEDLIIENILMDLVIERTTKRSRKLAESIHREISKKMTKKYALKDRGIRPGLFYVLALTKRPGILLEVGFISNERELRKMMDEKFQNDYARAVVKGMLKYLKSKKKNIPSLL